MVSWLCVGILSGLLLVRLAPISLGWMWLFGMPILLRIWSRRTTIVVILIFLTGCGIGLQRGTLLYHQLKTYDKLYGHKVVINGTVTNDPAFDQFGKVDFRISKVQVGAQKLPGQIRIKAFGAKGVRRGDHIVAKGKLYEGFGSYQASILFATVQITNQNNHFIETMRQRLFVGVYNALPDPHASLGLGFLIGYTAQLPDTLQDQLRALALTHIVVASGYNLTILIRFSRRLIASRSRLLAFVFSNLLMLVMLGATGLSPSMFRASIVTFLALSAWYFGRQPHPVALLLVGAAITAGWNPQYIWSDLGWWLSFLAFTGVLLLCPLIISRLYGQRSPPLVLQIIIETFAAQIVVVPFIIGIFAQVSVLGLLANILVVPFIPFAMCATFIAGIVGCVLPAMAGWSAVPAHFLLTYIVDVVQLLSSVPWASQKLTSNKFEVVTLYICLFSAAFLLYHRTHFCFAKTPNIVE